MYHDSFDTWWWPFIFILFAGVLPTAVWRWAGALLVENVDDDDSEILLFVRCVATALLAALIAQFVLYPTGALATIPTLVRVLAAGLSFAAFLASGNRLIVAIVVGETCLVVGALFS